MASIAAKLLLSDALENYCLTQVVLGGSGASHGLAAGWFATTKFLILGVILAWLLFSYIAYGRKAPARLPV